MIVELPDDQHQRRQQEDHQPSRGGRRGDDGPSAHPGHRPRLRGRSRGLNRGGQLRQPRASLSGDRGACPATARPPNRRLDAEIRVGADAGAGEVVVLRLAGELADHASSVVLPFLLPDTPVVAWWPAMRPAVPAQDPLGQLAIRRITDATNSSDPLAAIKSRLKGYTAGDTDLAWSRITYWRALLASALDQAPFEPINSALVSGLKTSPRSTFSPAGWPAGSTARCSGPSAI